MELLQSIDIILSASCPLRDVWTTSTNNPWLTTDILEQIKLKDDLMILACETHARNSTKDLVDGVRADYLTTRLSNSKGDGRAFWKTFNEIIPSKESSAERIDLLNDQGLPIPGVCGSY